MRLREETSILIITLILLAFGILFLAYTYGIGFPSVTSLKASIIKTPDGFLVAEDITLSHPATLRFAYPAAWNATLTCQGEYEEHITDDTRILTCHGTRMRLSLITPDASFLLYPRSLPVHHALIDDGTRHTASYLPRGTLLAYTPSLTLPRSPFPLHALLILILILLPALFWYAFGREKPVGNIGLLKTPPRDDRTAAEVDVLMHHTLTPRGLIATLHELAEQGVLTLQGRDTVRGKHAFILRVRQGETHGLGRIIHTTLSQADGDHLIYLQREQDADIIAFIPEDRVDSSQRLKRFAEEAEAYVHSLQDTFYKQGKPLFTFLILTLLTLGFILLTLQRVHEALMLFGYSGAYTLIYTLSPPSLFRSFREDYYHEFIEWLSFRAFLNTPSEVLATPFTRHVNHAQWFRYSIILGVEMTWLGILRSMHLDILADEFESFLHEYHDFTLALGKRLFKRLSDIEDVFLR